MLSPSNPEAGDRRVFRRTFLVFATVIGVGPLAVDSTLPAVRDMADNLGTDMGAVQASMGAFIAGMAAGQLLFGPMSDRFGRRVPLLLGLSAYVVTGAALAFATSIEPVFVLRFIQGLGSSAVFVISRAVVRDLFDVAASARMFASLFQVLAIFPVIGPIIAGALTQSYGWRVVFAVTSAFTTLGLVIVWMGLKESIVERDRDALHVGRMAGAFAVLLGDPAFRGCLVIGMGAYIGLMTMIAAMPPIVAGQLGGTPTLVGNLHAMVMAVHLAAAAVGSRLIRKFGLRRMLASGVALLTLAAIISVALAASGWITAFTVVVANSVVMMGFAFSNPAMTAGALSNFKHMAGRATAILGFLQGATGALTIFLIGLASDGSAVPHAVGVAVAGISALGAYLFMVRPLKLASA